jgi:hypothetical protein
MRTLIGEKAIDPQMGHSEVGAVISDVEPAKPDITKRE